MSEFPKWVVPDASHVVRSGDHISTPGWVTHIVDRVTNIVSVLVDNEDEEAKALSVVKEIKPEDLNKPIDFVVDAISRDVRLHITKAAAKTESENRQKKQALLGELERAEIQRRVDVAKVRAEEDKQAAVSLAAKVAEITNDHED